jgi:hypothetical protein
MAATAGMLGAAALAADTLEEIALGTVRDVHDAVVARVHGVVDRVAGGRTASHRVHDLVAGGVFVGLGHGLRGSARVLRAADRAGPGPALEDSPAGRSLLAAVNGLIGDRLRAEVPEMSFDAAVRQAGRDVPVTADGLRSAFPGATDAVVVFVHGLCETEEHWRRSSRPRRADGSSLPSYGDRLAAAHGWTPVDLRLNTGLPIQENGVAVAALLVRLVEEWPVRVRRIALVGHSMGGLVLRAACAVAVDPPAPDGRPWTELVTDVVTLGAPHLGAPLERLVATGSGLLGRLPESAPFGRILEHRSVGILDLRGGLAPDAQNLPHARYHLVAGSLSTSPRHPVALGIGDLLVQPRSAFGRPRRGPEMFPGADTLHVPGADHFDLLNHEDVHAALLAWLAD